MDDIDLNKRFTKNIKLIIIISNFLSLAAKYIVIELRKVLKAFDDAVSVDPIN